MLSAILIGNNIVNVAAASITTSLAYSLGGSAVAIANAVITGCNPLIRRDHTEDYSDNPC